MNPNEELIIESTGDCPSKAVMVIAHDGTIMRRTDSGSVTIEKETKGKGNT